MCKALVVEIGEILQNGKEKELRTESLGMPIFGGWPGEEPLHSPKLKKRVQGGNGNRAAESLEEQVYKWQESRV